MAKPSLYSDELAATIFARLCEGEPLAQICRDEGMPAARTVRDWVLQNEAFRNGYEAAREVGADAIAADALHIIDTPVAGVVEKLERVLKPRAPGAADDAPPEYELVVVETRREDMLGHRRLQFEGRLKLLSKWFPKRYGDKVELAGSLAVNWPLPKPPLED